MKTGIKTQIIHRFCRFSAGVLAILLMVSFSASAENKGGYTVSAKSVIFSDSTRVKRLYGKRVHDRVLPASTTKVMTALLVLEKLPLGKYVKVSERASLAQPSKIYVKPGEEYKVADLLYAVLLKSANDASIVLAEAIAGTEWEFVNLMNRRAREIGAKHTKFANSSGLPTKSGTQYTTAYDMYLIFRQALKHEFFEKAITVKYMTISSKQGRQVKLKSHNKILFFDWKQKLFGKTGWTRSAKACFVGTTKKGGSTLIIAIFGCTRRWEDIKYIVEHYGHIDL